MKNILSESEKQNPFRVEEFRDFLANKGLLSKFKSTYSENYSSIEDLNSSVFWNKIFLTSGPKEIESSIVKDRIQNIIKIVSKKSGKLLDVGLGYGFLEKELLKAKLKNILLHGIDVSDVAIQEAKKNLTGKFIKGSILKIPFENSFFDIILCLEVLEHISPYLTFVALQELFRVLKKNGILIITIPINEGLEVMYKKGINPSSHVRIYTEKIIKSELKIAGFTILKEKYFYAFRNCYFLKKILKETIFRNRWKPNNLLIVARKR